MEVLVAAKLIVSPSISAMPPPSKPLQRSSNSSFQLALASVWRHTMSAMSGPAGAVAGSLNADPLDGHTGVSHDRQADTRLVRA